MLSILTYHYFEGNQPPVDILPGDIRYLVRATEFEAHLKHLLNHRIFPLGLDDLEQTHGAPSGRMNCMITIDDAHLSAYQIAFPLLQKYQMKALFFIPFAKAGEPNAMSWDQIKEIRDSGHGIGAHGYHHLPLTNLAPDKLELEVVAAKFELEKKLNRTINAYAIPMGYSNGEILSYLRKTGYQYVFSSNRGYNNRRRDVYSRFMIKRGNDTQCLHRYLEYSPARAMAFSFRNQLATLKKRIIPYKLDHFITSRTLRG
jgi:peptidoglycan/xylan/chitin deacetylase (PgdA/CDA1 family)